MSTPKSLRHGRPSGRRPEADDQHCAGVQAKESSVLSVHASGKSTTKMRGIVSSCLPGTAQWRRSAPLAGAGPFSFWASAPIPAIPAILGRVFFLSMSSPPRGLHGQSKDNLGMAAAATAIAAGAKPRERGFLRPCKDAGEIAQMSHDLSDLNPVCDVAEEVRTDRL